MNRRAIAAVGGVALLGVGWALFRPDLLFIDQTVNEDFPVAAAMTMVTLPASDNGMQDSMPEVVEVPKESIRVVGPDGSKLTTINGLLDAMIQC